MNDIESVMAREIAQIASAYQTDRTGHAPASVTVVLSDETLVITLHDALTPAEKALALHPAARPKCRIFIDSCFLARPAHCGKRLRESRVARCAKRPPKLSRLQVPWCTPLRPETSCKCFD